MTIRPDLRLAVSPQLRDDYAIGRSYYELDGTAIEPPMILRACPSPELLVWHEAEVYLAQCQPRQLPRVWRQRDANDRLRSAQPASDASDRECRELLYLHIGHAL